MYSPSSLLSVLAVCFSRIRESRPLINDVSVSRDIVKPIDNDWSSGSRRIGVYS